MRYTLAFLPFLFSVSLAQAQLIAHQLVSIDTQQSPLTEELVINSNSIFHEVFRNSKYTFSQPRLHQTILLRRTIEEECLQRITNTVIKDTSKQTVTWLSTLERGVCTEKRTRHMVIAIPRPPADFEVIFDTLWTDIDTSRQDQKTAKIPLNPISCELTPTAGSSFYPLPAVINNDSLYMRYWLGGALSCRPAIDFTSEMILANSYGGDCHMQLRPHSFFDPLTNTLILDVYKVYGGCRAGGQIPLAVLIPKPPGEKFAVVFQEIQIDNWTEYRNYINGKH